MTAITRLPKTRSGWLATLLGSLIFSISAIASADTIVRLGTEHHDRTINEGYDGDLEILHRDVQLRRNALRTAPLKTPEHDQSRQDQSRHPHFEAGVIIADVKSSVYYDADGDGFYTRFSLNFDVDSDYGYEYVYARIYLRQNNQQYQLFHVTEVFEIYSDLSSDRYRVDSRLLADFDAAFYDVKIEVLTAGGNGVQDEVSAATHSSLNALPLEADQLDGGGGNGNIVVHEHAGSSSWLLLLLLAAFACYSLPRCACVTRRRHS